MPKQICVDVNIALKLALNEPDSEIVRAQWHEWLTEGAQLVAPFFFVYEGTSEIRLKVTRKIISEENGEMAFQKFLSLSSDVHLVTTPDLNDRAWNLAKQLSQSHVYDAFYLALAESLGCEFWTADDRLYFSAHRTFPWVKHISFSK